MIITVVAISQYLDIFHFLKLLQSSKKTRLSDRRLLISADFSKKAVLSRENLFIEQIYQRIIRTILPFLWQLIERSAKILHQKNEWISFASMDYYNINPHYYI
jgi:hypothetical protein